MPGLKYGVGDPEVLNLLTLLSSHLMHIEEGDVKVLSLKARLSKLPASPDRDRIEDNLNKIQPVLEGIRRETLVALRSLTTMIGGRE